MTTFREPTKEIPHPFYLSSRLLMLSIDEPADLLVPEAEVLLEVLLDICPNAKALAHNWLLEEQKREHMKGKP